ncbi:DNA-binding response regulator, OmpR family, contains REC and winged-helix (wHTH) domain [Paenibacillus algorifonticola]|uniref:DNA-binding response regulator, OmpR family, contains REC and winged-helix (WHTH) domain n=1 Tax=Paenibacillus algorifonticola TaxID=684063 RepID=A0A1I1YSQ2_9BACL|nr:response regulator transcription factor [Paenibacillus algorifonticola]SFE22576.1 DNA-binding response regulator, OmpR family, contains REC and winged-helix (wHTH) domain [Paenibacillus algorifonticola]
MGEKLLIIEDDVEISKMVADYLEQEGYHSTVVHDGEQALPLFDSENFDLVLLDLMLPKLSGLEVLQRIRDKSRVPILIISAKNSEVDKALGLRFGADDYIAKPFSLLELAARVHSSIRRATQYSNSSTGNEMEEKRFSYEDIIVDSENYIVLKHNKEIKLTAKEFQILKLFIQNPQRVYTKAQLYQLVWNEEYYGDKNVINVHMRRLREKIEDDPSNPRYIHTLWGIGYRMGGQ